MCQLLGMNCAEPTDFRFSLRGFCRRGGITDVHSHGWGACIYEGKRGAVRTFHDTLPACDSPIAMLLMKHYTLRTHNMMAHIRYATRGEVLLENVHPFSRELWGIQWSFAHNGDCPTFSSSASSSSSSSGKFPASIPLLGKTRYPEGVLYVPVGDTDSEAVFCAILNALKAEFPNGNRDPPTTPQLYDFLRRLCREIIDKSSHGGSDGTRAPGSTNLRQCAGSDHAHHDADAGGGGENPETTIFNFLLCCGAYNMFAYSWPGSRPGSKVWNGLHYLIREPPFSTAKLVDFDDSKDDGGGCSCPDDNEGATIDFSKVTTPDDRVAVVTTKPLTEEGRGRWVEMKRGELLLFNHGRVYEDPESCQSVEQEGWGLFPVDRRRPMTAATETTVPTNGSGAAPLSPGSDAGGEQDTPRAAAKIAATEAGTASSVLHRADGQDGHADSAAPITDYGSSHASDASSLACHDDGVLLIGKQQSPLPFVNAADNRVSISATEVRGGGTGSSVILETTLAKVPLATLAAT